MSSEIKLTVGGVNYVVKGDESPEYMKELGNILEEKLSYFIKQNPNLSTTMAAIMVALDCCDEVKKSQLEISSLKAKISELEDYKFSLFAEQMEIGD